LLKMAAVALVDVVDVADEVVGVEDVVDDAVVVEDVEGRIRAL
jgi:hypothetical protein